jgi:hypothetical protein
MLEFDANGVECSAHNTEQHLNVHDKTFKVCIALCLNVLSYGAVWRTVPLVL